MNRKLKRYLDETDRAERKIAELEEYLKTVREAQKKEEDTEIVKTIRSMKLGGRELLALLNGLQAGTVTITPQEETEEDSASPAENKNEQVPEDAPESEVMGHEKD